MTTKKHISKLANTFRKVYGLPFGVSFKVAKCYYRGEAMLAFDIIKGYGKKYTVSHIFKDSSYDDTFGWCQTYELVFIDKKTGDTFSVEYRDDWGIDLLDITATLMKGGDLA